MDFQPNIPSICCGNQSEFRGRRIAGGDDAFPVFHDSDRSALFCDLFRDFPLLQEAGIEQKYKTNDSIEIKLPSQEIVNHFPFKEGMYAIITAGRNVGKHGSIKEFQWRFGPRASTVTLLSPDGTEVQTTPEYIFVIGEKSPWFKPHGDDKK